MNKWTASPAIVTLAGLVAPAFVGDYSVAYQDALQHASLSLLNYLDHHKLLVMLVLGLWVFRFR